VAKADTDQVNVTNRDFMSNDYAKHPPKDDPLGGSQDRRGGIRPVPRKSDKGPQSKRLGRAAYSL